jgi:hypothetical protein
MTPFVFRQRIVDPTLSLISTIPEIKLPVSAEASVVVLTIAGQESDWRHRRQVGGPARSYWQFEKGGGVAELFQKTPRQLAAICAVLDIPYEISTVFEAMAWNDTLACTMARLLLWHDRAALPAIGDHQTAWHYYLRNWRPGAPHPDAWPANYDKALTAITPAGRT